jgi:hypothetical protein
VELRHTLDNQTYQKVLNAVIMGHEAKAPASLLPGQCHPFPRSRVLLRNLTRKEQFAKIPACYKRTNIRHRKTAPMQHARVHRDLFHRKNDVLSKAGDPPDNDKNGHSDTRVNNTNW